MPDRYTVVLISQCQALTGRLISDVDPISDGPMPDPHTRPPARPQPLPVHRPDHAMVRLLTRIARFLCLQKSASQEGDGEDNRKSGGRNEPSEDVRSVAAMYPICDRAACTCNPSTTTTTTTPTPSSLSTPVTPPARSTTTSSHSTAERPMQDVSRAEAAAYARRLLAMLPTNIPRIPQTAMGVGLKVLEPEGRR